MSTSDNSSRENRITQQLQREIEAPLGKKQPSENKKAAAFCTPKCVTKFGNAIINKYLSSLINLIDIISSTCLEHTNDATWGIEQNSSWQRWTPFSLYFSCLVKPNPSRDRFPRNVIYAKTWITKRIKLFLKWLNDASSFVFNHNATAFHLPTHLSIIVQLLTNCSCLGTKYSE